MLVKMTQYFFTKNIMGKDTVNHLWGFDPLEVLTKTSFPNDDNEFKIRHSKKARQTAISRFNDKKAEFALAKSSFLAPGVQDNSVLAEDIAVKKTSQIQKEQLARSAAAITIQAYIRGWATKRRYMNIMNAFLTNKTHRDGALVDAALPSVFNLKLQEKLLRKYKIYCQYLDKRKILPPEFSSFCAVMIQANWNRFKIYRAYQKLKAVLYL
jgi:hypothetical protein